MISDAAINTLKKKSSLQATLGNERIFFVVIVC